MVRNAAQINYSDKLLELFPYVADKGMHFRFLICNVLDPESWLQLDSKWARLSAATDNDGDGVPDSGDLPITEETLGSLPTKTDTDDDGLSDLGELTAAFYRESNPLLPDTDGDGLLDGDDPFPLYSYNDQISHGEPWIDGFIGEDEYVEVVSSYVRGNPDIGATIYATWSEGILYLAFDITDDKVKTPYKGASWAFNDNLEINIDSQQDGWGWSDDRNYRFCVVPMGSGGNPFVFGEYKSFATGSKETHEIDVSTLSAKYALRPGGYRVEMAIPASLMPEVDVNIGSSMRLTFWVRDYDAYGDWPKFNIFTGMKGEVPGFVKVYLVSRVVQMVGYWKLDETAGSIAHDSAGNNNGTLNGEPVWQPTGGKVDGALELDGIDDYVSTPFILDPAAGAFSAFAWINGGAPGQVIISQTDGTGSGGTWVGSETSDGKLMTGLVSPAVGRFVPQPMESELLITDGQWHHIGFVWDGSYRYLYVDGIEVAKDTKALAPLKSSDGGLYFGAGRALDAASFWSGLIDGVCIYDQALGSEDVEALYLEGWITPPPPPPPATDPLSESLDTALRFTTGGSADWFSQTTTTRYDGDAAQSGDISHRQDSWMQTTVSGTGTIKFYWKVSSEEDFDFLEFYIDGSLQEKISGLEGDWERQTYTISTSGSHTLEWRYVKDGDGYSGSDCGWVDKVEWVAN